MKMASEDVIELGSSDDDEVPAKKRKPALNAMVHFPNKLPGMVIKSQKNVAAPIPRVLPSGSVTITKTVKPVFLSNKVKQNNRLPQKTPPKIPLKVPHNVVQRGPKTTVRNTLTKPIIIQNHLSINPLNVLKLRQVPKLPLPPGITVKRTATGQKISPDVSVIKKKIIRAKPPEKMMTTVDLDDEVVPVASGPGPQWYLRPEEQMNELTEDIQEKEPKDDKLDVASTMEMENNKEPDTPKLIEITIEDSPVKPVGSKRMFEVGTELAITIDDSPVKAPQEEPCSSGSESEMPSPSTPHSKKKLEYQKNEKDSVTNETGTQMVVEIDLENCLVAEEPEPEPSTSNKINQEQIDKVNERKEKKSTQKRIQPVLITKEVTKNKTNEEEPQSDNGEFHPIYQKFINLCFEIENSDDMKKIVERKIKTYYKQCPKAYVESEEFIDMVSSKIFAIRAMPDKMYLYIKDIVDELNMQRKNAKAIDQVSNKENEKKEDKYFYKEETENTSKRARQIRKLEKTIRKLHRAIQKLEEQEVEFEDEDDSVYLLTERYKERLVRVYGKFCQLTNTKMPSEPRIQIESRPGHPTGPAKRLEKWVNRKVPIGTPLPFPDFHDVLRCVRTANEEDRLGWNEADIMEEARDLFTRCGKKLQRRRQENEWRIAASRITHDTSAVDPAEQSDFLKKKLEENKKLAAKKETELLNKYADKQNQLKLVGEEIGDKEAEESPVESEEEEGNDDSNALENKQKRKDRLKRLLKEKSRKMSVEKENNSKIELTDNEGEINNVSKEEKHEEKQEEKSSTSEEKENKEEDINDAHTSNTEIVKEATGHIEIKPDNDVKKEKEVDSGDVDSDIDELHLLRKLYSENEMNSSTLDSDSDSPIAISDSLDSENEAENSEKQQNYEVISIENSSYSESEMSQKECSNDKNMKSAVEVNVSSKHKSETVQCDENILLASSDEEIEHTETHFKNKKNEIIDQIIVDDCDDQAEENLITTDRPDSMELNEMTTEGNVTVEKQIIALEEQNNLNKDGKCEIDESKSDLKMIENDEPIKDIIDSITNKEHINEVNNFTHKIDEPKSKIVIENEQFSNDIIDKATNKKHIDEENNMIIDEYTTQNLEGSSEKVTLSEAGNNENMKNVISVQTNLDICESHNNTEVVSLSNDETIEKNISCLNEDHKSSPNSVNVSLAENKIIDCEIPEDTKMDISEECFETSESLKEQQANVSENIETSCV